MKFKKPMTIIAKQNRGNQRAIPLRTASWRAAFNMSVRGGFSRVFVTEVVYRLECLETLRAKEYEKQIRTCTSLSGPTIDDKTSTGSSSTGGGRQGILRRCQRCSMRDHNRKTTCHPCVATIHKGDNGCAAPMDRDPSLPQSRSRDPIPPSLRRNLR